MNYFQLTFLNNTLSKYLIFLAITLFGIIVIKIVTTYARKHFSLLNNASNQIIKNIIKNTIPLLYYGSFYFGTKLLYLGPNLNKGINRITLIVITITGVRLIINLFTFMIDNYWIKNEEDKNSTITKGLINVLKIIVWILATIIILDNSGVKISALVAGLGIGGIAVALASQAILGDLFSYFMIIFDRPFEVGDFISVNEFMGNVEYIGVKTTRLRSINGEQIIISNTDLTSSRLRNFKRMEKRRVTFKIGVPLETSNEHLEIIPELIREIIIDIKDTIFDRAHFSAIGDYSLIFEIVYYVSTSDYIRYMNIQQDINLKIKKEFEKRGIEFAYPIQNIILKKPI